MQQRSNILDLRTVRFNVKSDKAARIAYSSVLLDSVPSFNCFLTIRWLGRFRHWMWNWDTFHVRCEGWGKSRDRN